MKKANYKVLQKNFDKAFIEVVEYLDKHWEQHGKFRHKKELFFLLELNPNHWSSIRNAERNVPVAKIDGIKRFLVKEFGVREQFLETNKGDMFQQGLFNAEIGDFENSKDEPINKQTDHFIATMKREVDFLKTENQSLKEIIILQKELIENLRETSRSRAKSRAI